MTPLAESYLRGTFRQEELRAAQDHILRASCFDCSEVMDLATMLRDSWEEMGSTTEEFFLPSPNTWLEYNKTQMNAWDFTWTDENVQKFPRTAILLIDLPHVHYPEDRPDTRWVDVWSFPGDRDYGNWGLVDITHGMRRKSLHSRLTPRFRVGAPAYHEQQLLEQFHGSKEDLVTKLGTWIEELFPIIFPLLSIINSPNIIPREIVKAGGSRQSRRRLASRLGINHRRLVFTKINLEVLSHENTKTNNESNRITGKKCLHYCRSFLRIRKGKLERVRAHWRGDPALGIKRGDYTVQP